MPLSKHLAAIAIAIACAGCAQSDTGFTFNVPGFSGQRPPDEEVIAMVLDDVHRGMESRRIYKVLSHVSQNYRDAQGRDYKGIQQYLNSIFNRYRDIRINRTRPRIVVQGDRARAIETFGTIAEPMPNSDDVPINLQGQVSVYLEKVNGTWKIVEWGRMM